MPLTPSLTKPLAPSWANRFKEQSLERGRRYALENRVRIVESGDSTIIASCEGSGGNVYRQTISLRESAKGLLILVDSRCTCPVHTNCKHIAAVLLKVQETLAYPAAAQDAELLEKLQAVLDNRVVLPQVVIEDALPIPRLWLASVEFSAFEPRNGKMQRYIQHRAALSFNYRGNYVSGQKNADIIVREETRSLRIKRHPELEQPYREQLRLLGFKIATRQSKALPESAGELFEMVNDSAWLNFTLNASPTLRSEGWELQIDEDFGFDLSPVDDWYATVDEGPERDWFDLELGIIVNGERLSLLPILLNLMRSHTEILNPEKVARRRDDELILVNIPGLPNGHGPLQVALPYGRLKPVLATLGEFYLQEAGTTTLRLAKADAIRLNPLEDLPLQWEGGEKIRNFAQRLRDIKDFTCVAPEGLNATLRPYQLEGLSWMQSLRQLDVGGILADDMGLGKTLQTLAHILSEKIAGRQDRPCMVVMPTSLIPNWLDEAAHFTPQLNVLALYGAGRKKHFANLQDYDLLLTTYALLPKDIDHLATLPLHVLILELFMAFSRSLRCRFRVITNYSSKRYAKRLPRCSMTRRNVAPGFASRSAAKPWSTCGPAPPTRTAPKPGTAIPSSTCSPAPRPSLPSRPCNWWPRASCNWTRPWPGTGRHSRQPARKPSPCASCSAIRPGCRRSARCCLPKPCMTGN